MFELRPYQATAIERVREAIRAGYRRVLIVIATGGGKTVTAGQIISNTVDNGARAIFLAHRKELIEQCSKTLDRDLGIDHGVIKRNHPRRDREKQVQVASIQTLINRDHWPAKLIVIDEAHRSVAKTYVKLIERYEDPIVLGLTATPYRRDGQPLGRKYDEAGNEIGFGFDALVEVITTQELVDGGFLVNPTIFGCANPDLSVLKVGSQGDYSKKSASKAVQKTILHGEIITNWAKICGEATGAETIWGEVPIDADGDEIQGELFINDASGKTRRKVLYTDCDACTVAFLPTVDDSKKLAEQFKAAGVPAAHVDGDTPEKEREQILNDLRDRKIHVVCNVEILCLDEETEILTSTGWKGIDELTRFHQVANWWRDETITFSNPKQIIKRMRSPGERMVSVTGKHVNIRVTEDHRMLKVGGRNLQNFSVMKASELVGKRFHIPVTGFGRPDNIEITQDNLCDEKRYKRRIISNSHHLRANNGYAYDTSIEEAKRRLDRTLSLRRKNPDELTEDECWLIGFWIGDGSRTELQSGGVEYTISQSARYDGIIGKLKSALEGSGIDYRVRESSAEKSNFPSPHIQYRFSIPRGTGFGQQARRGLYPIEIYLDKDGAKELWGLDRNQLWSLLVGFWHADGNHGNGYPIPTSLRIANTNHHLLSTLQALAVSRGFAAYLSEPKNNGTNATMRISTLAINRNKSTHQLVTERLKFEDSWKKERVWCCNVESTFIITRRKGHVCVMGNCEGWDLPHLECVIGARITRSKSMYKQMGGRLMRPDDDKRFAYLLDHANWTRMHGFLAEPTEHSLEGREKRRRKDAANGAPTKDCPQCGSMHPLMTRICEECGYEFPARETVFTDEDLVELNGKNISSVSPIPLETRQKAFNLYAARCVEEKRNPKQAEYLYFKEFGEWPTSETGITMPKFFWQHKKKFKERKAQQAAAQKAANQA